MPTGDVPKIFKLDIIVKIPNEGNNIIKSKGLSLYMNK
jgi:NADPH-dependent 7-cyano-7-deazaguanine reductase QueF-like protein